MRRKYYRKCGVCGERHEQSEMIRDNSCLRPKDFIEYGKGAPLHGWKITNLKVYNKPKELSEFAIKRPPQSWCYVEEAYNG